MTTLASGRDRRAASALIVTGALLLMAGNMAHPIDSEATAVSRLELAADASWVPIHLVVALGFVLVTAGLVTVGRHTQPGRSPLAAQLSTTTAIVGGTLLVAVFGALDGYAVGALATTDADPDVILAAAIAEEAIDTGLAAMGTLAFFGLSVAGLGATVVRGGTLPRWIGWSGLVVGAAGTVAGVALLTNGPTGVTINVLLRPSAMAGTLWFLALGITVWRLDRREEVEEGAGRGAGVRAEPRQF